MIPIIQHLIDATVWPLWVLAIWALISSLRLAFKVFTSDDDES